MRRNSDEGRSRAEMKNIQVLKIKIEKKYLQHVVAPGSFVKILVELLLGAGVTVTARVSGVADIRVVGPVSAYFDGWARGGAENFSGFIGCQASSSQNSRFL